MYITFFMNVKVLLKPSVLKIVIFSILGIIFLYLASEKACAAGLSFSFCYKAYGFPFHYIATGDVDIAHGYLKTITLGRYFSKYGKFLFNGVALAIDIILIYLIACFVSLPFKNMKLKN